MTWNVVNTALALLALILATFSVFYAWKQVDLIRSEQRARQQAERENNEWADRADHLKRLLVPLVPRWSNGNNGLPNGPLYPMVFVEPDLRNSIETYLINRNQDRAQPRHLTPDLLARPVVREVIERVEREIENVRRNNAVLARLADLG